MKLVLCCPECGNKNWIDRSTLKDDIYECGACGEFVNTEDMTISHEKDDD